ncbi:MAG TPA: hypothetical protein VFQ85_13570 [Mycobacteriales bacterium]|jgi:hypothetical protein|nr:hypothetical protein [Mycobacteriales bacterium]
MRTHKMRSSALVVAAVAALMVPAMPAVADQQLNPVCYLDSDAPSRPTSALTMDFRASLTCATSYPGYSGAIQARVQRQLPDGTWEVVATADRDPKDPSQTKLLYTGSTAVSIKTGATCVAGPLRTYTIANFNGYQYFDYNPVFGGVRLCG